LERHINGLSQENTLLKQKQAQALQKPTLKEEKTQEENSKLTQIIDTLSRENQQLRRELQLPG
jgi:hypothetical protein